MTSETSTEQTASHRVDFERLVMPPGTSVEVRDTPIERHRPSAATILSGPDNGGRYWIEMSTGVQWNCPAYRLAGV